MSIFILSSIIICGSHYITHEDKCKVFRNKSIGSLQKTKEDHIIADIPVFEFCISLIGKNEYNLFELTAIVRVGIDADLKSV